MTQRSPAPRPPTPPTLASGREPSAFSPRLLIPPSVLTSSLGLRRREQTQQRTLIGGNSSAA